MKAARVAVACSGGRDSMALLHATAESAKALALDVVALHVHHGLSRQADGWHRLVEQQCERLGIACVARRIRTRPTRGDSIEAWAR